MDVPRPSKPTRRDRCSLPAPGSLRLLARIALFQSAGDGSKPSGSTKSFPLRLTAGCRALNAVVVVRIHEGEPSRCSSVGESVRLIRGRPPVRCRPPGPCRLSSVGEREVVDLRQREFDPLSRCQFAGVVQRQNAGLQNRAIRVRILAPVPLPLDVRASSLRSRRRSNPRRRSHLDCFVAYARSQGRRPLQPAALRSTSCANQAARER